MTIALRDDDRERGSISPAVAILSAMFLALAGLIIDSSRQLNAHSRAVAYAEEAARAGAQGVDPLLGPPLVLDPDAVLARVGDYCTAVRASDPTVTACRFVEIRGGQVHTAVSTSIQTGLLGLVNIQTLRATGTGAAQPYIGVSEKDAQ